MTIDSIYKKYRIPKNLQEHMVRVSAVGGYLCDYLQTLVDKNIVVQTLLLHDLGNLVKFDLSKGVELFYPEERNTEYWRKVQDQMKTRYGKDEHLATIEMAKEVNSPSEVIYLLTNIGSSNLQTAIDSFQWELKICSYSDFRVSPTGYVSVNDRFNDIIERYKGRSHDLANIGKTTTKRDLCLELEQQIQGKMNVDIKMLPEENLNLISRALMELEI